MALSSAADKSPTPSPVGSETPSTASPAAEWTHQLSAAPSEWAVISVASADSNHAENAAVSPSSSSLRPSRGSASDQSWQERDSGVVEPQEDVERAGEEMTLVLLSLMEHYRASLGLNTSTDVTTGAVELLRRLITEREELVEEVDTLRETLRTERLEWHQFQCDLQVAVSVADRLRSESEQALNSLQDRNRTVEDQLDQALRKHQETERQLVSLRAEHDDVCRKLTEIRLEQERQRKICRDGEEGRDAEEEEEEKVAEGTSDEVDGGGLSEEESEQQPRGKGVAESYLRSLAALEKKKDEGRGAKDPRKIVMLSERSWSLSRLTPPNQTALKDDSKNTSTTLPLCKKEEPTKVRNNRMLKRQDSWSSFYTGKQQQEEDQTSDSVRPQDGFSALLRRHGGSRRNSLLRWSQSRTEGYKNIDITNFSSSWEDGLAFCAIYHSYLPTQIDFNSLNPTDKKENLDLAFRMGETLGINSTLTVEEMMKSDGPDWQRVLGYVESVFRHFEM